VSFWDWLTGREPEVRQALTLDTLLEALVPADHITRAEAMTIPAFAGCVKYISETAASLPVKLYRRAGPGVEEVKNDPRLSLLNEDTGDIMTGYQFKQALVEDTIVEGGGYAYIRRVRNQWKSLHYISRKDLSFLPGADPINKRCQIMVNGKVYREMDFIKVTRKSKDGVQGVGVLQESPLALAVPYNALRYENVLVKTGGNKKGFLKSEKPLTQEAMDNLKKQWRDLYANNTENVVVLNNNMDFKEASSTSVEMQMNENKQTNAVSICNLFTVPPSVLSGTATDDEKDNAFTMAVLPVLSSMEAALNRDFLLESEKETLFWAFDTKELLKGAIDKRFAAYKAGIESNVLQIDEARRMENLPALGLSFVKLGLQDVLYDPESKTFYAPNTNQVGRLNGKKKGGNTDESRTES
jgi:phage portal protein, HK97 family